MDHTVVFGEDASTLGRISFSTFDRIVSSWKHGMHNVITTLSTISDEILITNNAPPQTASVNSNEQVRILWRNAVVPVPKQATRKRKTVTFNTLNNRLKLPPSGGIMQMLSTHCSRHDPQSTVNEEVRQTAAPSNNPEPGEFSHLIRIFSLPLTVSLGIKKKQKTN
jgi:hypothetical protein